MASTNGPATNYLVDELSSRAYDFDFFWAVRLLQTLHPDLPRVGASEGIEQDFIRFGQSPSLGFAPATLDQFTKTKGDQPAKLTVYFMGLFGPNGPLPLCVTEYALERELHHGDRTLTTFLDIFHHRMLSLFFRAWASSQKCVDADRPHRERFVEYIGSLMGLGMESLRERDVVRDWSKLFFSGRLAPQTRNAEGLEEILADYFRIPARVQSFVGRLLALPDDSRCELGQSPLTGSIGSTLIVGWHFWDCQMTFRIRLGPMSFSDYERILPDGESFERLRCWVLNYVGHEFFWEVQLVLRAAEVPHTCMGRAGKLGWTTWLKSEEFTRDADHLVTLGN